MVQVGYYDDHSQNRFREQKGNRGGVFLASVVGAILGAILVIIAIPALSNRGILPYQIETNDNNAVESNTNNNDTQNFTQKQIAYDVNTNTTKAVDKAADAVVGINNIQSSSFWSDQEADSQEEAAGTGSGVVYKKTGSKAYVVTNHHVVEGATKLEVSFSD